MLYNKSRKEQVESIDSMVAAQIRSHKVVENGVNNALVCLRLCFGFT